MSKKYNKKPIKAEKEPVKTEIKEIYVQEQSTPVKVEVLVEEKKVEEKPKVLSL